MTDPHSPNLNTDYFPMKCECGMQSPIGMGQSFRSPTIRTLSLVHQSSNHSSETYLLGSSGSTQRESLISFFRRLTHCRWACLDPLKGWQNLPQAHPSRAIYPITHAHQRHLPGLPKDTSWTSLSSVCNAPNCKSHSVNPQWSGRR